MPDVTMAYTGAGGGKPAHQTGNDPGALVSVTILKSGRSVHASAAVLFAMLPVQAVIAQTSPAEVQLSGIAPQVEGGKRIYQVAQFARFAPQSAADIVQQIPGFSITNVSNDRGLGEASQNVLINGQRITGKGNDALTVLRRIPASAVRGLEISDGAMLDISGLSGDVLDVLTEQDSVQGNFIWRPQIRERIPDHWPAGEVNVSGKGGIGDFSLGFRWDGFRGGGWGSETEVRPGTGVMLLRARQPRFAQDTPKLSGTLNHRTDSGSIWNINGSVERQRFHRNVTTLYQIAGEPGTTELNLGEDIKWRTEVGSDYEFALGEGRLKLVGFFTQRQGPNSNELLTQDEDGAAPAGSRFFRDSTEGERVLRSEYRWRGWNADWSVSVETADNFIDATGALDELDGNGVYQPVELSGASSRVEERRGESLLSFSRSIGAGWSLQVSGGGEYSKLIQEGDSGKTRSFWRPKGSVSLAWNPASLWEFNLKLQRKVGQLNFFDFLASVDVINNNNSNGSNAELVPPQSWLVKLETIRSLGRHGKVTLSVEGEDISDFVTQVPISPTTEAPGNLPKARRLLATLDTGLLLDAMGIPGGKLDTFLTVRDTSLRDPLFGTHRQFNGNRSYWSFDFRQDVPGTPWTWGLFSEYQSRNYNYRLNFEEIFYGSKPFGTVFLEHKSLFGLKVRVEVANVYNSRDRTQQVAYVDRRDGPVDYARDYTLTYHPIYRLRVSGTF